MSAGTAPSPSAARSRVSALRSWLAHGVRPACRRSSLGSAAGAPAAARGDRCVFESQERSLVVVVSRRLQLIGLAQPGWYVGVLGGRPGLVPANYIKG
jgi:hypothetical protein